MKNLLDNARKIYFDNFGSVFFMKRNGEYKLYQKCKVPITLEEEWKAMIEEKIARGLQDFKNIDLFSKNLLHLCYFDIPSINKCKIISKVIYKNDNIGADNWNIFLETQKSLYTEEFKIMLEDCIFKDC
ncbi:MAG: hypothetical protein WC278_05760 [Bacilli bacterium]|jgi:hypothetical protein|nr:hypothetical protein [Acholeplasmataceae bacterium]MDY0364161.1 hypothetical protein [Bacilli bacterium]